MPTATAVKIMASQVTGVQLNLDVEMACELRNFIGTTNEHSLGYNFGPIYYALANEQLGGKTNTKADRLGFIYHRLYEAYGVDGLEKLLKENEASKRAKTDNITVTLTRREASVVRSLFWGLHKLFPSLSESIFEKLRAAGAHAAHAANGDWEKVNTVRHLVIANT